MRVFLRDKDVSERLGVSPASIWRWSKTGGFPPPLALSPGCVRWRLADIQDWEERLAGEAAASIAQNAVHDEEQSSSSLNG